MIKIASIFIKSFDTLFIKLRAFLSFYFLLNMIFHGMTKIIEGGQTHGPVLLILHLMDQSEALCKSQGPFWLKSQIKIKETLMLYFS